MGSDKIVYGLGPLYIVSGSATTTFARDGGKSVRAELNGSGAVNASFRYRAYGAIAQSNGASTPTYLGYAGQLLDLSGLYYMRARWYEPVIGRFTTRDMEMGRTESPTSLNKYAYAVGNPVLYLDPSGRCAILCTAVIGAVIGGVVGGVSYALQQNARGEEIDLRKLALNVAVGAVEGAVIGAFLPGAGLATGAIWGAAEGAASDLSSQVVGNDYDFGKVNWGEVGGAMVGGAVGGFVSGGMLAPVAGLAVKDATTIVFANVASAELAFGFTVSGSALGEIGGNPYGGGGGQRRQ